MTEKKRVISKAIRYIEDHLGDEIKLDHIADSTHYSKFYLNRLFAETVGCTMYKYIQKRRLTEAARKLVTTDISIVDIAYEAKYESQQAFTLAFKQLYLYTPQIYRKKGIFLPNQEKFVMYSKPQMSCSNIVCFAKSTMNCEVAAA